MQMPRHELKLRIKTVILPRAVTNNALAVLATVMPGSAGPAHPREPARQGTLVYSAVSFLLHVRARWDDTLGIIDVLSISF